MRLRVFTIEPDKDDAGKRKFFSLFKCFEQRARGRILAMLCAAHYFLRIQSGMPFPPRWRLHARLSS